LKTAVDRRILVALAENGRVDADHFPGHVEKRSAGVARIDRCIGLNEIIVGPAPIALPLALTIPEVTVLAKPKGLPIAITHVRL
jgi:hypothetical protein